MSQKTFPCTKCGADLSFEPGTTGLKCPYCGTENVIPQSEEQIQELDFHAMVSAPGAVETVEEQTVTCEGCGATTTLSPEVTSDKCAFCGTNMVASPKETELIPPKSLLPFKIKQKEALQLFRDWVNSLWFAPNALKNYAGMESRLQGMYVPYWTYDSNTVSFYRGERGEHYYETKTYTETVDGKTVTKTKKVRKTRWHHVSGTVWENFDDLLVLASKSLPKDVTDRLEPWDLENLVPYADEYLSGFRSERYQVDLEEGFDEAKEVMDGTIRSNVRRDIGGDEQRIHSVSTQYNNVTFKHILLPIWVSSYRYTDKAYRFVVNGRTGEVQGERPWSWVKIALAVVAGLAVAGAVVAATMA